jgi:hypothetical protein
VFSSLPMIDTHYVFSLLLKTSGHLAMRANVSALLSVSDEATLSYDFREIILSCVSESEVGGLMPKGISRARPDIQAKTLSQFSRTRRIQLRSRSRLVLLCPNRPLGRVLNHFQLVHASGVLALSMLMNAGLSRRVTLEKDWSPRGCRDSRWNVRCNI